MSYQHHIFSWMPLNGQWLTNVTTAAAVSVTVVGWDFLHSHLQRNFQVVNLLHLSCMNSWDQTTGKMRSSSFYTFNDLVPWFKKRRKKNMNSIHFEVNFFSISFWFLISSWIGSCFMIITNQHRTWIDRLSFICL